jgi:hypothetical protein
MFKATVLTMLGMIAVASANIMEIPMENWL